MATGDTKQQSWANESLLIQLTNSRRKLSLSQHYPNHIDVSDEVAARRALIDTFRQNSLVDGSVNVVHREDERVFRIMRQNSISEGNVVVVIVIDAVEKEKE